MANVAMQKPIPMLIRFGFNGQFEGQWNRLGK
jgi:hypothetical protein